MSSSPYFVAVGCIVILPDIGDVLEEEHHEDVVLVAGGVHNAAEDVAGTPYCFVDVLLFNGRSFVIARSHPLPFELGFPQYIVLCAS